MIINNPEALKGWLSEVLAPLCEAEPIALARYVFALLKKDKPVKELKKSMTEQLDVFLGSETKPFLDRLFSAISSEEYLNQLPVTKNAIDAEIPPMPEAMEVKHEKECTPPLYDNKAKETTTKSAEITSNVSPDETQTPTADTVLPVGTIQNSPTKTSDKENQPRESRRRRVSLRSRSRSRSRSGERSRRSRSRDRRVNEKRVFRNKSPPPGERRRPERRVAERSPRPIGKNRTKSHSASRSRSGSPEHRKISRSSSPPANENNNINNGTNKRQRCRDFDEKGYCVRGETCPWDHGVNPVVLEGINNPTLIGMPSHLREYNPDAPELWNRSSAFQGARGPFPHKSGVVVPGNYTRPPGAGFRPTTAAFSFPINPAATPLQRELISVPVVDANAGGDVSASQSKRRYEPEDTVAVAEGPTKRKLPINSRLGPRVGPQQNCTLELRKIPRGMNTITHLNNHFSKFGKIVNIQISYEGDPEAATVTFSTHAEANVAYRSTEAVLNNRFIKVFWHSPGSTENPIVTTPKEDIVANGRKQSQYHLNNVVPAVPTTATESAKIINAAISSAGSTATSTAPTTVSSAMTPTAPAPGPVRLKTNRSITLPTTAIIRKKQEDHIKTAVQLAHGLHKRKHELLREYLKEMKAAVDLVEKTDPSDPARAKKLTTIKDLQVVIDKLRKEIATEQVQLSAQIQNQPPVKKTKEQQKKELLDLELELIAQQQEGNDTTAIQKRLEELQRSLGISSSSSTSHKTHFGRNMRVRNTVSTCVDRRPTTLLISGFDSEDSDLLLGHFKHFGEITKHEVDRSAPQLTISYATRLNAEQAVLRGRVFKEKRLQIAWAPTQNKVDNTASDSTTNKMSTESVPDNRLEDEEEEEDAESEDRSWRR